MSHFTLFDEQKRLRAMRRLETDLFLLSISTPLLSPINSENLRNTFLAQRPLQWISS